MTNKKSTKRALLASTLSLLLCCVMLVGTTLAWFAENDTLTVSSITFGNLDVELVDIDNTELEANSLQFVDENDNEVTKWLPGGVYYLKGIYVANNGDVELKYTVSVSKAESLTDVTVSVLDENENTLTDNATLAVDAKSDKAIWVKVVVSSDVSTDLMGTSVESPITITVKAAQTDTNAEYLED